jgi:hypothetical protein
MALSHRAMERLRFRQELREHSTPRQYRWFVEAERKKRKLEKDAARYHRYREIWSAILWVERSAREAGRLIVSPANNGVFRKKTLGG